MSRNGTGASSATGGGCPQLLRVGIVSASRAPRGAAKKSDAAREGGVGIRVCEEDCVARRNGISSWVIVVEAGPPSRELYRSVRFYRGLVQAGLPLRNGTEPIGWSAADLIKELSMAIASISGPTLIVGCGQLDEDTEALILELGRLPCYRALIGHRWLRRDPELFSRVARGWSYCQVNSGETGSLHTAKAALEFQRRLAHFSIRDGGDSGLLWADGRWFRIEGPTVQAADEATTGDLFGTAYTVARHFRRAGAREAVRYAERVVEECNQGRDVPRYAC